MATHFPHLFSPLEIRGKRLKNRTFMAAHGTGYAEDGKVGGQGYEYYKARVTRGIALLITEATQVVPVPGQKYALLNASTDECIPKFKALKTLCHENDCLYFGQLFHYGRAGAHSLDGSRQVNIGPSDTPDERHHIIPRPMTPSMIGDLVDKFGAAANRFYRAGADGIELLVGMGYLHAQFLSPRVNLRNDEYGGSPENRLRFICETLEAMRASSGEDFILGVRIAGEEYDQDGLRLEETIEACRSLEKKGLVDFFNICAAGTHTLAGTSHIVPPMFVDSGQTLPYAQAVKEQVTVPVFTCGRINQPQEAERAIAEGKIDMAGMVRALIADPEFVEKAESGRAEEIRACIACNQACIGHRLTGHGVSCIQFPETGRELEFGAKHPAKSPKRVMVVGGGPGGMKAAVVAAQRGHQVSLFEKSARLGGQALLAQALPGRTEFGGLVTNLESELSRFGVEIHKNTDVSAQAVLEAAPDTVVIATGATQRIPEGVFDEAHVVPAWDVIEGRANIGSRVVIADWRCDWVGLGLAEMLASEGCKVRLCVNGEMAGQSIQAYVRYLWAGRLSKLDVDVIPYVRLFGADSDTVYLQHIVTGDPVLCEDVDTLVLAYGTRSDTGLHDELVGKVQELHALGDCLSPRTAEEAVLEGLKIGSAV